jgi:hypothetical protein
MNTFGRHWPEYLIEGTPLGLFMMSACALTILPEHSARASCRADSRPICGMPWN